MRAHIWFAAVVCSGLLLSRATAQAPYIDGPSLGHRTLGRTVGDAARVTVLQVAKVNRDNGAITYRKVADLKGEEPATTIYHCLADDFPAQQRRQLLAWAAPGKTAVCFGHESYSTTCVGNCWYYSNAAAPAVWRAEDIDENLTAAYVGPVERLREHLDAILDGKEVVVTATALLPGGLYENETTPIVRDWLHGKKGRVWRVKASLKLADSSAVDKCPGGYFVGWSAGGKEVVPGLVAALKHDEATVRAEAAEDLGQIGPEAKAALPALRAALADDDGHVRVFAAEALARIDPDSKQSVPALLQALESRQPGVRAAAATALVALRDPARSVSAPLVAALRDDDPYTRAVIAFALSRLAPEADDPACPRRDVAAALGKRLREDTDEDVRLWAARALLKFGPDARPALPDLRAALKDRSADVASWAVEVLSRLGDDGHAALAEALGDKAFTARSYVANVLRDLGPHSKSVALALRKALGDEDPELRQSAAEALLRIDRPAGVRLGVPVLAQLATNRDYEYREFVIEFLGEVGPEAKAAVPKLIEILRSRDRAKFRWRAAEALGKIGPEARSAVPALIAALDTDRYSVRAESVRALGRIGPDARAALPRLRALLAEERSAFLALAVARVGDPREAAAVMLDEAINASKRVHREDALRALAEMGPAASSVLPALRKRLRDENGLADRWVACAICKIGRRVKTGETVLDERHEAIEALTALVREPDRRFGLYGVTEVVLELGPDAAPLVPALIAVLKDRKSREHDAALGALQAIGPAAVEAAPVLEAMLREDPTRIELAVYLARLGRPDLAAPAIPALVRAAEHSVRPNDFAWRRLLYDLLSFGPAARPAVPFLLRVMRRNDRDAYRLAARALLTTDPEAAARAGVYDAPLPPQRRQTGIGWRDDD
jgi:HEAT repeat protein